MERRIEVWRVAVFAEDAAGGNPAGVVADARGLSEREMVAVARHVGASETAFVLPPQDASHDVYVRFFTPECEVPVCGHATLAAQAVRSLSSPARSGTARQRSPGALWNVEWQRGSGDRVRATMVQEPITWGDVIDGAAAALLRAALGGGRPAVSPPPRIVSTGHPKVVVPVSSVAALRALTPDMEALRAFSAGAGVPGIFAFALTPPGDDALTECRMFAPAIGLDEDPVNGSGHGPLAAWLDRYGLLDGDGFVSRMGVAAGRAGRVHVEVERELGAVVRVRVGGDVVVMDRLQVDLAVEGTAAAAAGG